MRWLISGIDFLSKAGAAIGCIILVATTLLVTLEVVLRNFFQTTMYFTDEFSGYLVVAVLALGAGYAYRHDAMLRVDLIYDRLPQKMHTHFGVVFGLISLLFCALLDWQILRLWLRTLDNGTHANTVTATPLWLPQGLLLLGLILLTLAVLRRLLAPVEPQTPAVGTQA